MKHSVVWIEHSETQDACHLGENVPGFAPLNPCRDIRELIRAAFSIPVGPDREHN
jgi:hypothetical protein